MDNEQNISMLDRFIKPLKYANLVIEDRIKESLKSKEELKIVEPKSWIRAIRQALNMPTSHISKKIGKTPQAIIEFEKSEDEGKISIEVLRKVADAMDMKLVYGFVPKKHKSLFRMLFSAAWDKTGENFRSGVEDPRVRFRKNPKKYTYQKKLSTLDKVRNPSKSLWR